MALGQKATHDVEPEKKKLDLSAAQVAGSSLATVAAALLASKMGVYGTILGAGVVSVVATAGGPVIQHFFRRTGDQLRETARPKSRRVPAAVAEEFGEEFDEEFGEATVHGTRVRGWKRTAVAAGAAFAISMGALGTYEAMAGTSVSSGGGTIFSAGTRKAGDDKPAPSDEQSGAGTGEKGEKGGKGGKSPEPGTSPAPSGSPGGGGRSQSPDPSTSPSGTPSPPVTPTPPVTPSPPATPGTKPSHSGTPADPTPAGSAS
ncbi:hypothetical protein ACFWBN_09835 [Streptomyces sp. NPDC059989]|uniref:hypothetical protein n=1 Tax=Streptomyces sp. NPDC059989 TaxID=3347026 RepID=UPI00367A3C15